MVECTIDDDGDDAEVDKDDEDDDGGNNVCDVCPVEDVCKLPAVSPV